MYLSSLVSRYEPFSVLKKVEMEKEREPTVIDFSELQRFPGGEGLEALTRILGKSLGFAVDWSGQGPDLGKDLYFTERLEGLVSTTYIKWLVQCKDNSKSGKSVADLGKNYSILDKTKQHGCDGFLLVTTTTVTTGLKTTLDALSSNSTLKTFVWDRHELTKLLLQDSNRQIFQQFFPESYSAGEKRLPAFIALLRREADQHFGFQNFAMIKSGEIKQISLTDESVLGYVLDCEFPQILRESQDISEINLLLRAFVIDFKHSFRRKSPMMNKLDFVYEPFNASELPPAFFEHTEEFDDRCSVGQYLEIVTLTQKLLSIRVSYYQMKMGQSYPNMHTETLNFQLEPAMKLELRDLFIENQSELLARLCTIGIMKRKLALAEWTPEIDISDDEFVVRKTDPFIEPDETTKSWFENEFALDAFCITSTGLTFTFDPFEVATKDAGSFIVQVPFSEILDLIAPSSAVHEYAATLISH